MVHAYDGLPGQPDWAVARVLGWRQLLQAAACAGSPGACVLLLGAEADAAHALSAVMLAAADAPRRRAGLIEALLAWQAGPVVPIADGHGAVAWLACWRQCAAARAAAVAVPRVARHWTARGEER